MKLTLKDYGQSTLDLAPFLLGKVLTRRYNGDLLQGRIVEVEAYHQDGDRAAHSFGGKTRRNAVMFGPPGRLYVYFIYGMHYCMNVVTESEGVGAAVLIRGVEPMAGQAAMSQLRGKSIKPRDLTNGPAKCCRAFAVGPEQNGWDLCGSDLYLEDGALRENEIIQTSPRIGITKSAELPWRFFIQDNPFVSKVPRSKMAK